LRNLITNAIKFSNEKQRVYISAHPIDKKVFLTVRDEGIGISEEQIQQILQQKNTSTSGTQGEKGSGLGLFLVKELLQKVNASLLIESKVNEGSSFTICLDTI
jgi:signal transduction histidine kinase